MIFFNLSLNDTPTLLSFNLPFLCSLIKERAYEMIDYPSLLGPSIHTDIACPREPPATTSPFGCCFANVYSI